MADSVASTVSAAVDTVADKLGASSLTSQSYAQNLSGVGHFADLSYIRRTEQPSFKTDAPEIKPADPAQAHAQVVTPWDVQGSVSSDGKQLAIDYDKLIDQFGTRRIDQALLDRFEKLTGHKSHVLLRRGTFFSHR